jgi:hypothetical protein
MLQASKALQTAPKKSFQKLQRRTCMWTLHSIRSTTSDLQVAVKAWGSLRRNEGRSIQCGVNPFEFLRRLLSRQLVSASVASKFGLYFLLHLSSLHRARTAGSGILIRPIIITGHTHAKPCLIGTAHHLTLITMRGSPSPHNGVLYASKVYNTQSSATSTLDCFLTELFIGKWRCRCSWSAWAAVVPHFDGP